MPKLYLARTVRFRAAHRYFRPEWSEAKNVEVFGAAASEHGHGHSYRCRVTVGGVPDPMTGMIVDLSYLDQILREEVVTRLDGKHLSYDVPEYALGRTLPTGEEIALDVWRRVAPRLPEGCSLASVRVEEEPDLFAEYRGED